MNRHILLADDDKDLREILAFHFEHSGWKVTTVSTGKQALEAIEKGGLDLVISDLRMPEMTGVELLRKVKKLKETGRLLPPLVILTGMLDGGEDYLLKLGAAEILTKPIDFDFLLGIADRLSTPK